jgi:Ca-activated chloride channel family protein
MYRSTLAFIFLSICLGLLLGSGITMATETPIAIRVETQVLGKGAAGSVVGVVIEIAPVDRERVGERIKTSVTLRDSNRVVVDRQSAVIAVEGDGTALLYHEWRPGVYELQIIINPVNDDVTGLWIGEIEVGESEIPFAAPEGATADAVALELTPPQAGAVRILPPPDLGGIGGLRLEVETPDTTASLEFFHDGQPIMSRNRPPWTVSIPLGDYVRRTVIKAVARDAKGRLIGEDAIVLNNPTGQLGVEVMLSEPSSGVRAVRVAVSGAEELQEVTLSLDDRKIARWAECPCLIEVLEEEFERATILVADAVDRRGARGEAVLPLQGGSGFSGSVKVELVELPIVVLGSSGRPITGLDRDDFRIFEDDLEVKAEGFGTTADLPLSLAIAVDTSGSMEEIFPMVRKIVSDFVDSLLREGDEIVLLTFSWEPEVVLRWTDEIEAMAPKLERVVPEGGTALLDAVITSLELFRGRRGRQALILLTDGEDTTSRIRMSTAERYAHTMRIPIFSIGLKVRGFQLGTRGTLKDLSRETGGEAFFPKSVEALPAVYQRIDELLRSQYLIWYSSPSEKPVEEFRAVLVELIEGEGTVRTIRGYYPGK